jgi:hypothetical protein
MAVHDHDGLEEVLTLDQLKLNYATLVNCDPERDMVLAEVDGEVVSYASAACLRGRCWSLRAQRAIAPDARPSSP